MDNLVLLDESRVNLKNLFRKLEKLLTKLGLQYNEENTVYMIVKKRESILSVTSLNINKYSFKKVKHFKYHVTIIIEHN